MISFIKDSYKRNIYAYIFFMFSMKIGQHVYFVVVLITECNVNNLLYRYVCMYFINGDEI